MMLGGNNQHSLKSVNQLYMQSEEHMNGVHFKNWLDPLKREYANLSNNANTRPNMDFVHWLNKIATENERKSELQRNAQSERKRMSMKQSFENANDKKETPEEVKKGIAEQEKRRKEALKDNSILGMKPLVFYSVATVLVLAIGVGIYFTVKKFKASQTN